MYGKVLAAVNEHLNSEAAARYALAFAKAAGSKLYICYACERGAEKGDIERAEDAIKRLFEAAALAGIEAEAISERGDPVTTIKKVVKSEGIDLAFVSTRREDVRRRFYSGTTARSLLLGLPCSVALVRVTHMGRVRPKELLVPLKGRVGHIEERAYFTATLAKAFGSKVLLFHTAKPLVKFFHGEVHLKPAQWEERLPPDIARFAGLLERYGVGHERRLAPGRTPRAITVEAAHKRADLIVMGASEKGFLSAILRKSPVEALLRETPCDLIILKPRHEN